MTIRIDLTSKKATHLDNVVLKEGDVISFSDVSELDPPVPERVALLKLSPHVAGCDHGRADQGGAAQALSRPVTCDGRSGGLRGLHLVQLTGCTLAAGF